jgi:hypothetical protein
MAIFTVYEPPQRDDEDVVRHATRFMVVRDGFSWRAFAFGPLWMLRHRMWLVLTLYIALIFALVIGMSAMRIPGIVQFIAVFLISVLVGLESGTLRRWTYLRRGWRDLGIIAAANAEDAERKFFDRWARGVSIAEPDYALRSRSSGFAGDTSDIIGLFPLPGGSR